MASGASAIGGGMIIASLWSSAAVLLGGLGVALLLGAGIYIMWFEDDAVQKWLQSCLWRKVEEGLYGLPEIYPTQTMEQDAFESLFKTAEQ